MARDIRQAVASQAKMARKRFLDLLAPEPARATQNAVLEQCLAPNAQTVFGSEHGFSSIRDMDGYRAAVPIRHYDDLETWIDRAANGEPAVLTKEDPVRFWKTTGTTSTSKKIPVTSSSANRVTDSFLTLQGTQLEFFPELNERADTLLYSHLSPKKIKEHLGGGRFPFCSTTEVPIEVRRGLEDFVPPWLAPLQEAAEDDAERLYFLVCFASLHELYGIGCLHPSRFQTVANVLRESAPRLVKDLRDGTILGKKVRDPRPDRADELEKIASRTGGLAPSDLWPRLRFLSSWSGSYISRYAPVMEQAYGGVDFLAMPSISSECFMTMTIDKDRIGQPLNLRGGVFEFIPSGEDVLPSSRTLLAHELAAGETYEVVLTTLGGLYRYAMCDIFRVTGFVNTVPRLEYVGRRAVSDLTGEKLAEEQVLDSAKATLGAFGAASANYTLCAIQEGASGARPRYVLVLEPEPSWPRERSEELGRDLDARFKAVNSRYELKRNFNDLDPVRVEIVEPGTFIRYRGVLVGRGMPAGQLKDKVLHAAGGPVLADLLAASRSPGST